MSLASPHSQGLSPDNALQDRHAPDPYLSATSDPEEIYFQASAIRLTPSGSPGQTLGSPEDARIDSTLQTGYLDPRNDYNSACTSPLSDNAFVEPQAIELASGSSSWRDESFSSYRTDTSVPVNSAWSSPMAPNVFKWTRTSSEQNQNSSGALPSLEIDDTNAVQSIPSTYQAGLGVSYVPLNEPSRLGVTTNQEPNNELASDMTRGRSPVFKIETFSRGDSPKGRTTGHQRHRSQSSAHLSAADPNDLSSESEGSESDDHKSNSSVSVKRSPNGTWIRHPSTHLAGLDPSSRGNEYVPSPNDVLIKREREEKNEDITHWSVTVSRANSETGDEPPSPPRRHHVPSRLRARSTGDRPLKEEDYFSLKCRSVDRSFPGPGVLVHESSDELLSEDEESIATGSDSIPAIVDDPGRYDRSTPEIYSSLGPNQPDEGLRLYPWHDPPRDSTPRSEAMQPTSSTDAMIAFQKRVRDLETASLTATIDNNSIINVATSLEKFTLGDQPKKRTSLLKRPWIQASSKLKRQASDLSIISQSSTYPGIQPREEPEPQPKPSYSPRNVFSTRRHSRSPSLTNALLSMSSQMAAVGGSRSVQAVSPAPSPNPERNSLSLPLKGRGRSRSEVPRPSSPGLINLMTAHGGPPVPNITSPGRFSSDAAYTPRSTFLDIEPIGENDNNATKGIVMDFPAVQSLPDPTIEGFKSQIMQLNPRLEPALLHRLAHEQDRRYKLLVGLQQNHSHAVANQTCKSRTFCFSQGGKATVLPQSKAPIESETGQSQFRVKSFSPGNEKQHATSDGTGVAAQYPPGVPPPPVNHLPAQFECPICFEVKKFQKPSDWSKHVQEDIQPFTCTFPRCTEPKSFKRKADWVRHENEKHRQLEWWTCAFSECHHTCFRKDNFVQHLVREHKMPEPKLKTGKASEADIAPNNRREKDVKRLWQMVEECRHETDRTAQSEPCRFCGNVCSDWRKLSVHLGKHMEQLAMPVLHLVKPSAPSPANLTSHANLKEEPVRGSSATYPSLAYGHEPLETSSNNYTTRNTSTAIPAFSFNGPPVEFPTISGSPLIEEPESMPESMTDSLTPDQYAYGVGQFGSALHPSQAHAQAQTHPLHQNSLTYPPYAVPRPRTPETEAMNSYPMQVQSLYPADGTYAYQPDVNYSSATYSSGCSSRM
ncbi:hypothetical protein N7499_009338 [Penicillium canescens]|uniref:C2H2-type domain-containing protein n=1 Tax=Penicillium canescens TaxID=5083 RepID=A0AAD6INN8_PENCN|nr:uncharacterized protein N7446_008636 [Penicillium canescens]KAJ6033068.1 hypothetical protein N7444_010839 [Penicillium canescens]KAJ6057740.1 hypothetical protein N7460_001014 [Penicillium canescens]KAJ6059053.1 hypothetical protein N7446_008636 [Penicillium canescens]KAJ6071324.1 hypothetical protein N7499_009338 [Penicillium canescens]KAJ6170004.1 hypothetical protein N7485_007350 [Penicillium canescens]